MLLNSPAVFVNKDIATQEAEQEGYTTLYNRDDWDHWIDADGDCQDTRAEILIRDSQQPVRFKSDRQCNVTGGLWALPYTGGTVTNSRQLDDEHINSAEMGTWPWWGSMDIPTETSLCQ